MANVIPPDHVDDLPVVELNQLDVVPVIPEPVLVDEDEDSEEEEFKEEEEPQEEEEDMDIEDEEDENEPELTFSYKEADPLNPPKHADPKRLTHINDKPNIKITKKRKKFYCSLIVIQETSNYKFLLHQPRPHPSTLALVFQKGFSHFFLSRQCCLLGQE
ncbi:hypothetical protein Tco_0558646 [Tanacetum coccineum]